MTKGWTNLNEIRILPLSFRISSCMYFACTLNTYVRWSGLIFNLRLHNLRSNLRAGNTISLGNASQSNRISQGSTQIALRLSQLEVQLLSCSEDQMLLTIGRDDSKLRCWILVGSENRKPMIILTVFSTDAGIGMKQCTSESRLNM
jgi:hypothetical protein